MSKPVTTPLTLSSAVQTGFFSDGIHNETGVHFQTGLASFFRIAHRRPTANSMRQASWPATHSWGSARLL